MAKWAGAKFPDSPPSNYDPENPHADPVALVEYREYQVRRKEVGVAKAKVSTGACLQAEGQTDLQCKSITLSISITDPEGQNAPVLHQRRRESHSELQAGMQASQPTANVVYKYNRDCQCPLTTMYSHLSEFLADSGAVSGQHKGKQPAAFP